MNNFIVDSLDLEEEENEARGGLSEEEVRGKIRPRAASHDQIEERRGGYSHLPCLRDKPLTTHRFGDGARGLRGVRGGLSQVLCKNLATLCVRP